MEILGRETKLERKVLEKNAPYKMHHIKCTIGKCLRETFAKNNIGHEINFRASLFLEN